MDDGSLFRIFEKRELTLAQLQDIARVREAAERQTQNMEIIQIGSGAVNTLKGGRLKEKPMKYPTKRCYRCGREDRLAKEQICPAKNEACRKCGKEGHFSAQRRIKLKPPNKVDPKRTRSIVNLAIKFEGNVLNEEEDYDLTNKESDREETNRRY